MLLNGSQEGCRAKRAVDIDVGVCQSIIDGKIKVKQGSEIGSFTPLRVHTLQPIAIQSPMKEMG